MKASIVDLRYKTREILEALERNESVTVLYHGRVRGVIQPAGKKPAPGVAEHAFFGMHTDRTESVADEMERLRRHAFGRCLDRRDRGGAKPGARFEQCEAFQGS
ncbi:MAG: hypothetical protein RQ826_10800 [Xanthomonadales bacterium]|nr:hypothetical protein [Xanthomonadales bacterium]